MIKKIKDLSKVILNNQDVMLMATVKSKIKSGLDLSGMNQADLKTTEDLLKLEIVAVGAEVTQFKPKQLAVLKDRAPFPYSVLESETKDGSTIEFRVATIHMNNVEFAIDTDNFNE